jgi:CRP-like cAMP-binding protein
MLQLGFYSARKRLCELLWQLLSSREPDQHQNGTYLKLPLKQWEVAQLIAVTPEHLNRIVKEMQRQGILQWTKGTVTILDLKMLRDSTAP